MGGWIWLFRLQTKRRMMMTKTSEIRKVNAVKCSDREFAALCNKWWEEEQRIEQSGTLE